MFSFPHLTRRTEPFIMYDRIRRQRPSCSIWGVHIPTSRISRDGFQAPDAPCSSTSNWIQMWFAPLPKRRRISRNCKLSYRLVYSAYHDYRVTSRPFPANSTSGCISDEGCGKFPQQLLAIYPQKYSPSCILSCWRNFFGKLSIQFMFTTHINASAYPYGN